MTLVSLVCLLYALDTWIGETCRKSKMARRWCIDQNTPLDSCVTVLGTFTDQ